MVRIVKNAEVRRREIIDGAKQLFHDCGYEAATMNMLMKSLGIAKGTVYHYFKSKEHLLEAVVEDLIDNELARLQAVTTSTDFLKADAVSRLMILISSSSIEEENDKLLESLHRSGNEIIHIRQLARFIVKLAPLYAEVIEYGNQQGVFNVPDPLTYAEFMLSGFQFITDVGFYPWSEDDLARRNSAMTSLLQSMLSPPGGSF